MKVYKRLIICYILITIYYCRYSNAVPYGDTCNTPASVSWADTGGSPMPPYGHPPAPPIGHFRMPPNGGHGTPQNRGHPMLPNGLPSVERHPLPRMNLPIILKYGDFNKVADHIKIKIYDVPREAKHVRVIKMGSNNVDLHSDEYSVENAVISVRNFALDENKLFISLLTENAEECSKKQVIEENEFGNTNNWSDCFLKCQCEIHLDWAFTCDRLKGSYIPPNGNKGNNNINEHTDHSGADKWIITQAPFVGNIGSLGNTPHFDDVTTVTPFSVKGNKAKPDNDRHTGNRYSGSSGGNIQTNVNVTLRPTEEKINNGKGVTNPDKLPKNKEQPSTPALGTGNPGTTEATFSNDDSNLYYYIGAAIAVILLIFTMLLIYLKRTKKKSAILPMLDNQRTEVKDLGSDKVRVNQPLYAELDLQSRGGKKPVVEETPYAQIKSPDTVLYAQLDLPQSKQLPQVEETPYAQIIQLGPKT